MNFRLIRARRETYWHLLIRRRNKRFVSARNKLNTYGEINRFHSRANKVNNPIDSSMIREGLWFNAFIFAFGRGLAEIFI